MKKFDLTDKIGIDAVCLEVPILGEIRKGREVSVVHMEPAPGILTLAEVCANGFGSTGWAYGSKGGKILYEETWSDIRKGRAGRKMPNPEYMTAQTVLTGEEDMFVSVQEHKDENDSNKRWISIHAFLCAPRRTFGDYPEIITWLKQLEVRKKIDSLFS